MSSPIDMFAAVSMLSFNAITVSRRFRTFNAQGVAVLGDPVIIPMVVSVQTLGASSGQSAGGRSGLSVSTGFNLDQTRNAIFKYGGIVIFSTSALYTSDTPSGLQPDEVTWEGEVYTVVHVDWWPASNYWRVIAVKKDV